MTLQKYFATCARGLEGVLAQELRELPALDVAAGRGGVAFAGDQAVLYRANLWLRTAIRVLAPILESLGYDLKRAKTNLGLGRTHIRQLEPHDSTAASPNATNPVTA